MTQIIDTGERILLDKETPLMIARHFFAYRFARGYCRDKRVLDIGCGEGYGANYLAQSAKAVLGADYNSDAINYAKGKYAKYNLSFSLINFTQPPNLNEKFDVICSFQVIEHIKDVNFFLKNIKAQLDAYGTFICSTPNKLDA